MNLRAEPVKPAYRAKKPHADTAWELGGQPGCGDLVNLLMPRPNRSKAWGPIQSGTGGGEPLFVDLPVSDPACLPAGR